MWFLLFVVTLHLWSDESLRTLPPRGAVDHSVLDKMKRVCDDLMKGKFMNASDPTNMQVFDQTMGFPGEGPNGNTTTPKRKRSKKGSKQNKKTADEYRSRASQRQADADNLVLDKCNLENCVHAEEPCCENRDCSIDYTPYQIQRFRNYFFHLSRKDKKVWKQHRIVSSAHEMERHVVTGLKGRRCNRYFLDAPDSLALTRLNGISRMHIKQPPPNTLQRVCMRFFHFVLDSSTSTYQPGVHSRQFSTENTRDGNTNPGIMSTMIIRWLVREGQYSLILPDSDLTVLPWPSKKDTFYAFKEDMKERGIPDIDIPCDTHFYHVWKHNEETKHIVTRKWIPFAKCDQCCSIRERKEQTTDRLVHDQLRDEMRAHIGTIRAERAAYYERRQMSIENPKEYLSLIIDGADQKMYDLPHSKVQSKTEAIEWLVPVKIMGVLAHGRGSWAFTHLKNCKSGTNITIEVIHRVLVSILDAEGKLPDKLFIQLDNTTRQCKSRFVLGYLSYLVECGVFKKVVVSFLPKGHTHEDIDQMFSRFSLRMRKSTVWSREDMGAVLKQSFHDNWSAELTVVHLESVTNFSDWIDEYVPKGHYTNITKFHQFRIWRRVAGVVSFSVRERTATGDQFTGLRDLSNWTDSFPAGTPPEVEAADFPPAQRFEPSAGRNAGQGGCLFICVQSLFMSLLMSLLMFFYVNAITHTEDTVSQMVVKMYKGVSAMEELYGRSSPDCARILALMKSTEDIPCEWSPSDVKSLYHDYRHKRLNAQHVRNHEDEVWDMPKNQMDGVSHETLIRGKANCWYLMKAQDRRHYWIGRAVMVDHDEFQGEQWRGVRIQYWEATHTRNKMAAKHYALDAPNVLPRDAR